MLDKKITILFKISDFENKEINPLEAFNKYIKEQVDKFSIFNDHKNKIKTVEICGKDADALFNSLVSWIKEHHKFNSITDATLVSQLLWLESGPKRKAAVSESTANVIVN